MTTTLRSLRGAAAAVLATGLLAGGGSAHAADLGGVHPKAPAAAAAAFDWSGFYLGGHVGGFYGRDDVRTPGGELLRPISIHDGSVFAGGYAGYNIQMSRLVLGIEGDVSSVVGGRALSARQATIAPGIFAKGASDPGWLITASARLGLAAGSWLLYAKAGGAWLQADYTATVENAAGTVLATQALSTTRAGWLVGAGLEYGWTRNWLSRIEYNYIDFGTERLTYTLAGLNAADFDSAAHVVKVGLGYKFGGF